MDLIQRSLSFLNGNCKKNEDKGDVEMAMISSNPSEDIYSRDLTELLNYHDERGRNLLMIAASERKKDKVRYLLENGFDPNSSHDGRTAVSVAYNNKDYDTVLVFLENDSRFPDGFEADKITHDGLKAFVTKTRKFYEKKKRSKGLTDANVKAITQLYPNVRHIYGVDGEDFNRSAVFVSVTLQKLDNLDTLQRHKFLSTSEEFESLRNNPDLKEKLSFGVDGRLHQKKTSISDEKLAETLCSKSFLGGCFKKTTRVKRYDAAWRMFDELRKIEKIRPLLRFLATSSDLIISFDFEKDHCVSFFIPGESMNSICLGAMKLLENDEHKKLQTCMKFAAEACRFVMKRMSMSPRQKRSIKAMVEECKSNSIDDKLVSDVFNCKKVKSIEMELVSIVPQRIVLHSHDMARLENKKLEFPLLYDFYETELINFAMESCAEFSIEIDGLLRGLDEKTQKPKWNMSTRQHLLMMIGLTGLLVLVNIAFTILEFKHKNQNDKIKHGAYGQCGEIKVKNLTGQALVTGHGSIDAYPGQWPWLGALFYNGTVEISGVDQIYESFICGSSLITKYHLLSAAHCFPNHDIESYYALLGRYDLNEHSDANSVKRDIHNLHIHPDYKSDRKHRKSTADVAVLRMTEGVIFTDFIQPVCFPRPEVNVINRKGVVAGYGNFDSHKLHENKPKYIELNTMSAENCIFLDKENYVNVVSNGSFCAGNSTATPCKGDSGGGFFVKSGDRQKFILTGVVSQALNANLCDPKDYVVFVNMLSYRKWIVEKIAICGDEDECVNPCDMNPCEKEQKCTVGTNNTYTCS